MSLSADRNREGRLFEGSLRIILKAPLGVPAADDANEAGVIAGEDGEEAEAEGLGELAPDWAESVLAKEAMAGCTLTGSIPSRWTICSLARMERSAEGCKVAGVFESVMQCVARSRWCSSWN